MNSRIKKTSMSFCNKLIDTFFSFFGGRNVNYSYKFESGSSFEYIYNRTRRYNKYTEYYSNGNIQMECYYINPYYGWKYEEFEQRRGSRTPLKILPKFGLKYQNIFTHGEPNSYHGINKRFYEMKNGCKKIVALYDYSVLESFKRYHKNGYEVKNGNFYKNKKIFFY